MKYLLALLLVGCSQIHNMDFPISRPHGRAGLLSMAEGIQEAAEQCTYYAQHAKSTEFANWCVDRLIPAKDAVIVAFHASQRWDASSEAKVACAGAATSTALRTVSEALLARRVHVGTRVEDAIVLADELGAGSTCDPLHPTTLVTVTEDNTHPHIEAK